MDVGTVYATAIRANKSEVKKSEGRQKMKTGKITVEEFVFDEVEGGRDVGSKPKLDGRMSKKDLFAEIKLRMVMRIYGVSRFRAAKIIAERCKTTSAPAVDKDRAAAAMSNRRLYDDDMIPVDDLFAG